MAKPTRVTDPRIERSRRLVLEAALAELATLGYGGFTIESVAARSGVAKSTIYRHWPSKLPLIADAFESLNVQPQAAGTNELPHAARERIAQLLQHLAAVMRDSQFSACIPALIDAAERDRAVRKFHHRYSARRMESLVRAVAEGIATGELSADLDPALAALALVGPIFYCRLMKGDAFPPERVADLVRTVLGPPPKRRA
jgi:AcrR family transcriptional regulator